MTSAPAPSGWSFTRGRAVRVGALLGLCAVAVAVLAFGSHSWAASSDPSPGPGSEAPVAKPTVVSTPTEPTPPARFIRSMGRVDANVGWVRTDVWTLRWTYDHGSTWSDPLALPAVWWSWDEPSLDFVDAEHGWVLDAAPGRLAQHFVVFRTTDGGRTWQSATVDMGGVFAAAGLHFRDRLHGELFATRDAGAAAEPTPSPTIGRTCQRYSTADGGVTWSGPREAPCVVSVTFMDALFGYADDIAASVLYITTDGGQSWTGGKLPVSQDVMDSGTYLVQRRADGKLRALAMDPPTLLESADGGRTWTFLDTKSQTVGNYLLPLPRQVVAVSDSHWLAIDQELHANMDVLFSSNDGGLDWGKANQPAVEVLAMDFVDAKDGWLLVPEIVWGDMYEDYRHVFSNSLWSTTDGGATWNLILRP
jgi:photosystem II stability/assembly factor-like uncharacterized protein